MAQYNLLNFDWDSQPSTSNRFGTHEYIWYNRTDIDGEDDSVTTIHTIIRAGIPGYSAADFDADLMLMQYQSSRAAGVVDPESINLSVASSDNPDDEETLDMLFGDTWRSFLDTIEDTARSGFADNPPTQVMTAVDDDKDEPATAEDDSVSDGAGVALTGTQLTDMIVEAARARALDDEFDPETEKELDLLYGMSDDTEEDTADYTAEDIADYTTDDTADDTTDDTADYTADDISGDVDFGIEDEDDISGDVDFGIDDEDDEDDEPRGYDNDFDDEFLDSGIEDEDEEDEDDEDTTEDSDEGSEVNGYTRDVADVDDVLETLRRQYGNEFVEQMIYRAQDK